LDRAALECRGDRFGVGAAAAGGMPASAFAAGERVDAVVGDDIKRCLRSMM
jgi:hypothetical protein